MGLVYTPTQQQCAKGSFPSNLHQSIWLEWVDIPLWFWCAYSWWPKMLKLFFSTYPFGIDRSFLQIKHLFRCAVHFDRFSAFWLWSSVDVLPILKSDFKFFLVIIFCQIRSGDVFLAFCRLSLGTVYDFLHFLLQQFWEEALFQTVTWVSGLHERNWPTGYFLVWEWDQQFCPIFQI